MFRGVHHLSIDPKGRMAMPARHRDRLQAISAGQLVATIDTQSKCSGRVLVPPALREYAGLDKKAVLVGQGNKMELWDEDTWLAERDKWLQMASVEGAVPDEMLRLSL